MIDNTTIKREFCNQNSKIAKFQKKIAHLEKCKKFQVIELEKMPETREAIKKKAKELYDRSTGYRLKGFDKQYSLFMNAGASELGKLEANTKARTQVGIDNYDKTIGELESRIKPIREDQINQESTIKNILFKEFLQCGKVI